MGAPQGPDPVSTIMQYMSLLGRCTAALMVLGALAACDTSPGQGDALAATAHAPSHVDSIFPIEEELRRFRAALPDPATTLEPGAQSIDELVARFLDALEAADTDALGELVITPAEFAYLHYPHTRFTRRPYEMSPALVWFQLENYGSKGLNRALARFGGRPLEHTGYDCPVDPEQEGPNRIWSGCVIRRTDPVSGDAVSLSLFGGIIEHGGRFKFINYANRL